MKTIEVWVGEAIIYLYGTVNGEAATFTLIGGGQWQAIVPRSETDEYLLHLEAYSVNGLEGTYDYVLYYGMMPVVIDRTAIDVINKTEKGFYNHTDLNRVGHNVDYLSGVLNGYGYAVVVTPKENWVVGEIPRVAEMDLYLTDLNALKAAFYGTTELPDNMAFIDYKDANNIEKLLAEIEIYINRMIQGFRKCGTFNSGQGVILP